MNYDLLIKGGMVLDPGQGIFEQLDIAITGEHISAIEENIPSSRAKQLLDASGRIVTPGLIDLHTHIYWGVGRMWLDPDTIAAHSGVTTMVDAGTANADSFPGFKRFIVERSQTRVYSFINANPFGIIAAPEDPITSMRMKPITVHLTETVKTIKDNRDIIIGIKTFAGYNNERYGERFLELANELAYRAQVPIMVHISFAPPRIEEVLPMLHKGDILTHSFTGHTQRLIDREGHLLPEAREALDRGVLLDIGHGAGSFSFQVAEALLDQGVLPYTISTDLYERCLNGPTYDLPTTLSKFLNLGLSLEDVILRATANPAKIIGGPEGLGALKVGGIADIAILEVLKGEFTFIDAHQEILKGDKKLVARHTICRGKEMK